MYVHHSFSEHLHFGCDSEARCLGSGHKAVGAFWSAVGSANSDITVEVGAAEAKFFRGAMGEMGNSGGGNVSAPTVLQSHCDAHADAQIAGLFGFCQAAELA